MSSKNYTIYTAAEAFSTTARNIRHLMHQSIIPSTIEVEGQRVRYLLPEAANYLRARQVRLGDDGYLAARQIVDNANTKAKIKRYAEAKRQA